MALATSGCSEEFGKRGFLESGNQDLTTLVQLIQVFQKPVQFIDVRVDNLLQKMGDGGLRSEREVTDFAIVARSEAASL